MANYALFEPAIKRAEGGFQILPSDPGNYNSLGELVGTNYGTSAIFYEDILGRPPTIADMKAITQNYAHNLFKIHFWDKLQGDFIISQKVAETLADHAINAGNGSAIKVIQKTLNTYFGNNLAVDGGLGSLTLTAINSVPENDLFLAFSKERILDYNTKNNCDDFCPIWHDRVEDLANDHGVDLNQNINPVTGSDSKKKTALIVAVVLVASAAAIVQLNKKKKRK